MVVCTVLVIYSTSTGMFITFFTKLVFYLFLFFLFILRWHWYKSYCLVPEDNRLLTILQMLLSWELKCAIAILMLHLWYNDSISYKKVHVHDFMCQLWAFREVGVNLTIKLIFLLPAIWVCSSVIICNIDVLHMGITNFIHCLVKKSDHKL